ncbi:MAG TPA: DmsC/YnfH family molybdoenzyme membrane anchor subunit [Gammaproteobacteria bacterium]
MQTNWDWRAAGNFVFGGAGSGLLFVGALGVGGLASPALLLPALLLVGLGLSLVWAELGRPLRALNVFFHPHTSWMTREAVVATALFLLGVLALLFASAAMLWLAGLAGFAFLFCQGRILHAAKGIPAWRAPLTPWLIVATGLTEGAALAGILAALGLGSGAGAAAVLLVLLLVRALLWAAYRRRVGDAAAPPATRAVLDGLNLPLQLAGHLVPALLLLAALASPGLQPAALLLGGLLALAAGWYLKYSLVTRAAQVQGFELGPLFTGGTSPRLPLA